MVPIIVSSVYSFVHIYSMIALITPNACCFYVEVALLVFPNVQLDWMLQGNMALQYLLPACAMVLIIQKGHKLLTRRLGVMVMSMWFYACEASKNVCFAVFHTWFHQNKSGLRMPLQFLFSSTTMHVCLVNLWVYCTAIGGFETEHCDSVLPFSNNNHLVWLGSLWLDKKPYHAPPNKRYGSKYNQHGNWTTAYDLDHAFQFVMWFQGFWFHASMSLVQDGSATEPLRSGC